MARRRRLADHHGILRIDKPSGLTSHDVVARVRRIFGQRQVGHTGTLDPLATGLMILTLGNATRLGRFLEATEKQYSGVITLGRSTTTYDTEGETVDSAEVPPLTLAQVEVAAASLTGTLVQQVPAFSAVKVDGERLYAKARRNEEIDLPSREVHIHDLDITDVQGPDVHIATRVSKGTYIRSLAVQLGAALGLPAHLSQLRRTAVGPFFVTDAAVLDPEKLGPADLVTPADALNFMPALVMDEGAAARVQFGQAPGVGQVKAQGEFEAGADLRVLDPEGVLLAVGEALFSSAGLQDANVDLPAVRFACVICGK